MCKPHGRERGEGGVDGGWREVVGGWEPPGRRGKGCLPCRQDSWPPEGSSMHLLHLNTSRCHGKWIDSLKPSKSIFTSFVLYHRWYRAWQTLDPQKYGKYGDSESASLHLFEVHYTISYGSLQTFLYKGFDMM